MQVLAARAVLMDPSLRKLYIQMQDHAEFVALRESEQRKEKGAFGERRREDGGSYEKVRGGARRRPIRARGGVCLADEEAHVSGWGQLDYRAEHAVALSTSGSDGVVLALYSLVSHIMPSLCPSCTAL